VKSAALVEEMAAAEGDVTKKPWPEIARSVGESVWVKVPPCDTSCWVVAATPPATSETVPLVEVTRLSKSVSLCL